MTDIEFSTHDVQKMTHKLKQYFEVELDCDLGNLQAEGLIDFLAKEIGHVYYNQGLSDAQTIVSSKVEEISDAIYEIERPVD